MIDSEKAIKKLLERRGYKVLKDGYPDFLTITPNGTLEFVEVKSGMDRLSRKQKDVFRLLEKFGMTVYIYNEKGERFTLKDFRPKRYSSKDYSSLEQRREWRRRYKEKHPEKMKKLKREYYQRHKEQVKQKTKEWRRAHPEYHKEYYKKHREWFRAYFKKFKLKQIS